MTDIYSSDIQACIDVLNKGGTILYPTDTIWGIGCDATNATAIRKVFRIKQRDESKSLITLVSDMDMLQQYVERIPPKVIELMSITQRPLTIIYQHAKGLAPNTIAEDGSVAIRIPKDDFCHDLVKTFGKPIVSTSANISGQGAAARFGDIRPEIVSVVDYVVKYRQGDERPNQASKIVKVVGEHISVLRD